MSIDIFISYAREDSRRFRQISNAENLLSSMGYTVWRDDKLPAGEAYPYELARAIEAARLVIVFWGDASVLSQWVYEEAERGKRADKLVPVSISKVTIPMGFGLLQAIDLSEWSGEEGSSDFQRLLAAVVARLGEPPDRKRERELLRGFQEYIMREHGYDLESAMDTGPDDSIDDFLDVAGSVEFANENDVEFDDPRQAAVWTFVFDVAPHLYVDLPARIELPTINTVGDLLDFMVEVGTTHSRLTADESRAKLSDILGLIGDLRQRRE